MKLRWKILISIASLVGIIILFAVLYAACTPFQALILYGTDLHKIDDYGYTSLHTAAHDDNGKMIHYLLDKGVEKNQRNRRGETPYNIALIYGNQQAADILTNAGADMSLPVFPKLNGPYMGQTPPGNTPELFMPGIVSARFDHHTPIVFSPDGNEAYWTEAGPADWCVMGMRQINGQWTPPRRSTIMQSEPSFSTDGQKLFFNSWKNPQTGTGGDKENIWVMERSDSGWSDPAPLGEGVNGIQVHFHHSVDSVGNLYFSDYGQMYVSLFRNEHYQDAVDLAVHHKNETHQGNSPFISPHGDYVLFTVHHGLRGSHIVIAFLQTDGSWTDRISLGDTINSGRLYESARVSPDGKYLFFVSAGGDRPSGIYWVSSGIIKTLRPVN